MMIAFARLVALRALLSTRDSITMTSYLLPYHRSQTCSDPLDLCESNAEHVKRSEVLKVLFQNAEEQMDLFALPRLIEDIAYTLHGDGTVDTGSLRLHLTSFTSPSVRPIIDIARNLPRLFESHRLPVLSTSRSNWTYTMYRSHVDALLAHYLLGTLTQPLGTDWGRPSLLSWYKRVEDQAHPKAIDGYLHIIGDHFHRGGYGSSGPLEYCYTLGFAANMPDPATSDAIPKVRVLIVSEPVEPFHDAGDSEDQHYRFVLVAANKQPGPGPNGTQEERLQASSPALMLSSLLCPIIPEDAALVTSSFPVHGSWTGHNRTAQQSGLYTVDKRPSRRYILADALELDISEHEGPGLADLAPGNVEREVRKLYAGFREAAYVAGKAHGRRAIIEASAWGCGAFGGNLFVKVVCMAIAAALSEVALDLTLLRDRTEGFEAVRVVRCCKNAGELWRILTAPEMRYSCSSEDLVWKMDRLKLG